MDHDVSLSIIKVTKNRAEAAEYTPKEHAYHNIIRLFFTFRLLHLREYEESATMLRIRRAWCARFTPRVIRQMSCSDYRLRVYQSETREVHANNFEDSNIERYQYGPLPSNRYIRLLELHRGIFPNPITCSLNLVSLDNAPNFVALSYAWGKPQRAHSIACDGSTMLITQNLWEAMSQLRSPDTTLTLWIDALCINQADELERNSQVGIMGEIFRKASQVNVWIGCGDERSERGLGLAQKLLSIVTNFKGDTMSYDSLIEAGVPPPDHEDWRALESVYWRPWWTRVWVIQEICLSRKALLICGSISVDAWGLFEIASFVARSAIQVTTGLNTGSAIFFGNLHEAYCRGENLSLFSLLLETRPFRASDNRDKIYSLLGICSVQDASRIDADYNKADPQVYRELAVQFLRQGSLDFLTAVCDPFWRRTTFLPSWVPDWTTHSRVTEFLRPSCAISGSATGDSFSDIQFSTGGLELIVQGIVIDSISRTCRPFLFRSLHERVAEGGKMENYLIRTLRPQQNNLGGEMVLRMGLRLLCWENHATKLKSYPTKEELLLVFLRTITAGLSAQGSDGPDLLAQYKSYCLVHMIAPRERPLDATDYANSCIFSKAFYRASWGRTMFVTKQGLLGIGPFSIRAGDEVVLLQGGKTPYILRKKKGKYTLVGECYVHGIMHGEAFTPEKGLTTFCIA